jgi:hypothetical protein
MSEKHTKIVVEVRKRLRDYGVSKDESICDAIDRLTAEHALAIEQTRVYKALAEQAQQETALAKRTRDGAQEASNRALAKERSATFENRSLRFMLRVFVEQHGAYLEHQSETTLAEIEAGSRAITDEAKTTRLEDDLRVVEARRVEAFAKAMQGKCFDTYGNQLPNETLRCSCCGEKWKIDEMGAWRWSGEQWEHKCPGLHPQAGHMPSNEKVGS